MTDTEINIAIAEACGWKRGKIKEHSFANPAKVIEVDRWINPSGIPERKTPDYRHDPSAMREALKTLSPSSRALFGEMLAVKLGANNDYYEGWTGIGPSFFFELATAPVELLAETFLRCKGLWKETIP